MKRIFTSLFAVFICSMALAQVSPKFSYQAVIRNASNELVVEDSVFIKIRLYNHDVSGTAVYSERHSVVSNKNGLVSIMIGEGMEVTGTLSLVTWDDSFLYTEVTLQGGYSVSDVKPLTSVPLAYYAERIPLQAIEEHLGSTNLVSADALRDTLTNYVTESELSDYVTVSDLSDSLSHYSTTDSGLLDTLANYVTTSGLSSTLANYVTVGDFDEALGDILTALADLRAITTTMEEFTVPAAPSNSFQLGFKPLSGMAAILYINGVCVSSSAYSVVNKQLTYLPGQNGGKELVEGDRIQFYYHHK